MRRLEVGEVHKPVRIGEYVSECSCKLDPFVTRDQLQIQHVYLNANESYYHVVIKYGERNQYLVIIVGCNREAVYGHYLLDIEREYGGGEASQNESVEH